MADLFGPSYKNMDDAATGASYALEHQPQIQDNEYATVIVQKADGSFYRTAFATNGSAGKVTLTNLFKNMAPGDKPVAVLHNHPGGPHAIFDPSYLSDNDTRTGQGVGDSGPLSMYLLAGNKDLRKGTGEMQRVMARTPDRAMMGLQKTDGVLGEVPIDEMKQRQARVSALDGRLPRQPLDSTATMAAMPSFEGSMGDTVKPANPAVTGKQRLAMVNAMTDGSMPGSQGSPPSPQTAPPKRHAKDMGGAPQPLPPGMNTFGSPIGVPAPSGLSPEQERAALIAALIRSNHNGTPTPMGAPQ